MGCSNRVVWVLGISLLAELSLLAVYRMPTSFNHVFRTYLVFNGSDYQDSIIATPARLENVEGYLKEREYRVKEVDCLKVFRGDKAEMSKALALEQKKVKIPSSNDMLKLASNCTKFIDHYRFLMDPLTEMERNFPIAFNILVYKDAAQILDLLRAVYRPHNSYCIHVDKKSPDDFYAALSAAAACLTNVFIASRRVDVQWGHYSVLEPEIVCMQDLWQNKTWKYLINLTGQEFPLRTNFELVRIFTAFGGANDISGGVPNQGTINYRWRKFLPAPHNIKLYKGGVHIAVSRQYVDYVLHAPAAQRFLKWCQQTLHPDEHFFNSIANNPHLSNGTDGNSFTSHKFHQHTPSFVRYKNWVPRFPCPGRRVVRGICILNVLDLPRLYTRNEIVANKFHSGYSTVALRCLAEFNFNRTRDQSLGLLDFNATVYERLPKVVLST